MRLGSLAVAAAMSVFVAPVGQTRVCHPASVRIASRNLCERSERGIRPIPAGRLPRRLQGCLLPGRIPARLLRAAGGLPSHLSARLPAGRVLPELLLRVHVPEFLLPTLRVSACLLSTGGPTLRACLLPAPLTRRTRQRAARPRGRVPASTKAAIQHDLTPKAEHDWYHRRKDRCRLGRRGSDLLWRGVRWATRGIGRCPKPGGKRRRS